ncbi:2Fe-2S iron-sulfur cluster-binding protein [Streptomyces sp. NPDC018347]|uniref:2Fe-2S iron-sulfur cluster-binding protein n=1 Tax=Streptomyces sp. NPDC018347 TaxID=3157193 RepID=UPI0033CA67FC
MTDDQHGEGTPQGGGRWNPLPQGDYDDGATAFVELPEGGIDALLSGDSPLAAPGHGYVPPPITATHPDGAQGGWPAPEGGAQWPDPNAAQGVPQAADDRFTYQPAATQQWTFDEPPAPAAPGHDVTGQWSIPVAGGDLPDESGEYTTSSLVEQWGGTPPATLPGGAPAPWATDGAGQVWDRPAAPDHTGAHPAGGAPENGYGTGYAGDVRTETGYPGDGHTEGGHQGAGYDGGHEGAGYGDAGREGAGYDGGHEGAGYDGGHEGAGYAEHGHADAGHVEAGHADAGHAEDGYGDAGHAENAHADAGHVDAGPADGSYPAAGHAEAEEAEAEHAEAGHPEAGPADVAHADVAHGAAGLAHADDGDGHGHGDRDGDGETSAEPVGPAQEAVAGAAGHDLAVAGADAHDPAVAGADAHDPAVAGADAHDPAEATAHDPAEATERPADVPADHERPTDPETASEPVTAAATAGPVTTEDPGIPGAPGTPAVPTAPDDTTAATAATAPGDPASADAPGQPEPVDAQPQPAAGAVVAETVPEDGADPAAVVPPPHDDHPLASYVLRVNGADRPVTDAWIGESLLYVLRERLGLAGAKDGCSQGECGACNVQVDGRLVASCLVPAVTAAGSEVRTVEGLAVDGQPSDVQRALARCGAVQCGFCVPGMAMTVHDLLEGNPAPTELEARQALCGNLCRCSGYRGVLEAVQEVVAEREASHAGPDTDVDEARIPHQAGPGSGGVHPSAFEAPGAFAAPRTAPDGYADPQGDGGYGATPDAYGTPPGPQDQHYGQDGGQA